VPVGTAAPCRMAWCTGEPSFVGPLSDRCGAALQHPCKDLPGRPDVDSSQLLFLIPSASGSRSTKKGDALPNTPGAVLILRPFSGSRARPALVKERHDMTCRGSPLKIAARIATSPECRSGSRTDPGQSSTMVGAG
jgi:hypothetical protein